MTKKDKIGWALVTPFLIAMAGVIILTSYVVITTCPWIALSVALLVAAAVGFVVLAHDSESISY